MTLSTVLTATLTVRVGGNQDTGVTLTGCLTMSNAGVTLTARLITSKTAVTLSAGVGNPARPLRGDPDRQGARATLPVNYPGHAGKSL